MPAGYGKVAVVEELEGRLDVRPDRTIYIGDGSSDVHVMLHVNNRDGFTVAVSENTHIARIAKRTVLSDSAFSVVVPILEDIVGWSRAQIRTRVRRLRPRVAGLDALAHRPRHPAAQRRGGGPGRPGGVMGGIEWLGWTATAVFTSSYVFRKATVLRGVQMAGAVLWIVYGAVLGAAPGRGRQRVGAWRGRCGGVAGSGGR